MFAVSGPRWQARRRFRIVAPGTSRSSLRVHAGCAGWSAHREVRWTAPHALRLLDELPWLEPRRASSRRDSMGALESLGANASILAAGVY
jgi:hypothetical protein